MSKTTILGRRGFIAHGGGWALAGLVHCTGAPVEARSAQGAAQGADADRTTATFADRAGRVLAAYDAQGLHRTATEADRESAEWLRHEAARAGGAARLERFALERLDVHAAFVELGGRRIEGLPFFDGGATSDAGAVGPIGPTSIHLAIANRAAIGSEGAFLAEVRRGNARAVVVVTEGDRPGLVPSNARAFAAPYGCAVVQVASDARAALEAAERAGSDVRVVCHTTRTTSEALNVVAEVPGRTATLAPLVVITPRSGWWQCAAERGGGIVCWLEAIRALAGTPPDRPAIFVASSGHELGHLGLEAFLHANEALSSTAHAWIHLGANIGAGAPDDPPVGVRLQASHDALEQRMTNALSATGAPMAGRLPRGQVPAGEARNLHLGGARYVSLLGQGNRWFHHPDDRYPRTITDSLVTRYAQAVARAVSELARA